MRISPDEIKRIKETAQKYFGASVVVYLFGSRIDDTKKGGDIDLYWKPSQKITDTVESKIKFLLELKNKIGEQKIDVVIAGDEKRLIDKIALEEGIKL